MKEEQEREAENKRHTMSHAPERIPDLDSPRLSRSPLKNDKKEKVIRSQRGQEEGIGEFLAIYL